MLFYRCDFCHEPCGTKRHEVFLERYDAQQINEDLRENMGDEDKVLFEDAGSYQGTRIVKLDVCDECFQEMEKVLVRKAGKADRE